MRWSLYAGVSVTLAAGVVVKAMHQRANFYAASVYLAKSTANLMILSNALLLAAGLFMLGLQRIFYGPLRPLEVEQLYEKAWIAITETCFAMTMFRGELGGWFLIMFLSLLTSRVWSWVGEGRVEILEQQPPANPRLFHTRLAASLVLSALFNSSMLEFCVRTVLKQARPDMMVMFGFEFAVLTTQSVSTIARYAISLVEIIVIRKQKHARLLERRAEIITSREETAGQGGNTDHLTPRDTTATDIQVDEADLDVPGWEEKGKWVLYLELLTDFVKLSTYLAFFWILLIFYGLPIHIFRDVYITFRSFVKRINDFRKYKNATRDMEARYPDATQEEISREDVCIICREEMRPVTRLNTGPARDEAQTRRPLGNSLQERMRPKKLPCGHVLHFSCLRSWLERQQICPTCRRPVMTPAEGNAGTMNQQQANAGGMHDGALGHNALQRGGNGQNEARVFQLGPLRIVFGRGRGNLYGDLANQIHQGDGAQQQQLDLPNAAGPQQIGFGFGIGRRPAQNPSQTPSRGTFSNMQAQLQRIENQLNQEINGLRATADQLNMVRALQLELERLRIPQNIRPNHPLGPMPSSTAPNFARPPQSFGQVLVPNDQQNLLQTGDDRLPEGLILPEGWTLMPLQRVEQRLPRITPGPPNTLTPDLVPPVVESTGPSLSGGVDNLTPSSSAQSALLIVPPTTQPSQLTTEAPSSSWNSNIQEAPMMPNPTVSHSNVDPPTEQLESMDTIQNANTETSSEPHRSEAPKLGTNTEDSTLESTALPSWGSQTSSVNPQALLNHKTETTDREARSSLASDHLTPANEADMDESSLAPSLEQEESRALAARVEDYIEDVD